ncbi:MAG: flagellar basal-body rod protein FlgB [Polyangiales bacterium]|jgi:flagellar basal-body rod protein FlgB
MSGIFDPLSHGHRALNYHMERHNVLASNVANIDTPGFNPSELVREVDSPTQTGAPAATHRSHIGASREPGEQTSERFEQVVRAGNDGNSVSLEREMAKVSANDLRFEAIGKMVRAQLGALRYAASDANG